MMVLLSLAFAQEELCNAIYSDEELSLALRDVQSLMKRGEVGRASNVMGGAYKNLRCLPSPVAREDLIAFGAVYSELSFLDQDIDQVLWWGRFVQLLDPEHAWDLPEGHPLPSVIAESEPATDSAEAGLAWVVDKGQVVFVNGRFEPVPVAYTDVPHLIQVFDKRGARQRGFWQGGGAYPKGLVGEGKPLKPPRFDPSKLSPGDAPPVGSGGANTAGGKSLLRPLPLAGAGLVVTSAVLYGLAGLSHQKFQCDPSTSATCPATADELTKLRTRTNTLVMAAAVTFTVGAGVGVTGVLVEDGGQLIVFGRF